jgi:hypothetical protein
LRRRQAFANVRDVNLSPVLALAGLAVVGLLAARLPRPRWPHLSGLDVLLAAGGPLVLLGLALGPGIDLLDRTALRGIAPVTALAIGWLGATLGARFEWRQVRRIPPAQWRVALVSATAALAAVALAARLALRLVPALGAAWAPRLPAILTLGAIAAASGPVVVALVARITGVGRRAARTAARWATLETAYAALLLTIPLALHRPRAPASGSSPVLEWLSAIVFTAGSGALAGMVYVSLARLRPGRADLNFALFATLLFGAGVGWAADLSPFVVCALAAAVIVNVAPAPRRHVARQLLDRWLPAACAVVLLVAGASLALPTRWILVAAPLAAGVRIAARWATVRYGRGPLRLTALPADAGLATAAQGGAAVALGLTFATMYGSGGVLTTVVLGTAVAQLAAPRLLRVALGTTPAPLTQAPALPELSPGRSTELTT